MKTKFICRNTFCGKQCECLTEEAPCFCLLSHPDYAREKYLFEAKAWRVQSESPTIEPEPVPEQDENHIVVDGVEYEAVKCNTCSGCAFEKNLDYDCCESPPCTATSRSDGRSVIWKRVEKAKEPLRITLNVENRW